MRKTEQVGDYDVQATERGRSGVDVLVLFEGDVMLASAGYASMTEAMQVGRDYAQAIMDHGRAAVCVECGEAFAYGDEGEPDDNTVCDNCIRDRRAMEQPLR
jgi:hypothetical protein